MITVTLPAKPIDELDFEPYGQILSPDSSNNVIEPESGVYVTPGVGQLEIAKGSLVFNYLTVKRCPLIVKTMERHVYTSQTVVPLLGCCGLYVIAPQAKNIDGPDVDKAFAIIFDGSEGVNIKKGTWHSAPLAISKKSTYVMVMRNGTFKDDLEVVDLEKEYNKIFEIKV